MSLLAVSQMVVQELDAEPADRPYRVIRGARLLLGQDREATSRVQIGIRAERSNLRD